MTEQTTFERLYSVDVSGRTERKGNLTYLSWAWAWAEVKKVFPQANYTIYENANGWIYHTDGRTCWVKTGVTIDGLEHIECLPVMDMRNQSIPLERVTSTDVNKAIQRSLTKAAARHGLGLYIYAGEDLPEPSEEYISAVAAKALEARCKALNVDMAALLRRYGVESPLELTEKDHADIHKLLSKEEKKKR